MTSTTPTMAGLMAHAGAARLEGHALLDGPAAPAVLTTTGVLGTTQGAYGHHQSASWTMGAIAKPSTFVVFDRKNRPTTRPLSELSP